MAEALLGDQGYTRELRGGLRLRWSSPADREPVGRLYREVFRDSPTEPLNSRVVAWLDDLMSGRHPLCGPGEVALVEELAGGTIVAAAVLLRQGWDYDGIGLPVGRVELVATLADYRQQGLIRAIFELLHARSAARGDLVQGITGIRYFYRQFGYEYALDLGGGCELPLTEIAQPHANELESCTLEAATSEDIPRLGALYDHWRSGWLVSTSVDIDYWRWLIEGQSQLTDAGHVIQRIVTSGEEHQTIGFVLVRSVREGTWLPIDGLLIEPTRSLPPLLPSLLRALRARALASPSYYPERPDAPVTGLQFRLGDGHPAYALLGQQRATRLLPPYAWYVRASSLPRLLLQLAPSLERRLAASLLHGYDGDLKLDFYRDGLKLTFERGRLVGSESWRAVIWHDEPHAAFPPLVFLQLLFGHRGLGELRAAFPDVWARSTSAPLLEVLFPRRRAWVVPLD